MSQVSPTQDGYLALYRRLDLSPMALDLAAGSLVSHWCEPVRWSGFPPAFLPLYGRNGADYGYWRHPLTPERRPTLVRFQGPAHIHATASVVEMFTGELHPSRRSQLLVTEVARSLEQLVWIELLDWICNGPDDEWTDAHRAFARGVGLDEAALDQLDAISTREFEPVAFLEHPAFVDDLPLSCFGRDTSAYPGDFPHPKMPLTAQRLRSTCTYELHSSYMYQPHASDEPDLRDRLADAPEAPPWLGSDALGAVFDERLSAGDLSGAWMTLCSIGWTQSNAADALQRLAEASGDEEVGWIAQAYAALDARAGY